VDRVEARSPVALPSRPGTRNSRAIATGLSAQVVALLDELAGHVKGPVVRASGDLAAIAVEAYLSVFHARFVIGIRPVPEGV